MLTRNVIKTDTTALSDLLAGVATAERDRMVADLAGIELFDLTQEPDEETGSIAFLDEGKGGHVLSWGEKHLVGRYGREGRERWVRDLIVTAPDCSVTIVSSAKDANEVTDLLWESEMEARMAERDDAIGHDA